MEIKPKFEIGDLVRKGNFPFRISEIEITINEKGTTIIYKFSFAGDYYSYDENDLVKLEDAK